MHDMHPTARLATQSHHHRDRLVLGIARPRAQKRIVSSWIQIGGVRGRLLDGSGHLSMNKKDRIESSDLGHRRSQIDFGDVRKLFNARMDKKALEPADTAVHQ